MSEREPRPEVVTFFDRLDAVGPGERARLKRNAGQPLAQARNALGLFYRLLPPGVHPAQTEWYFLVATLYPMAGGGGEGDFGAALRRARDERFGKGLDRRVEILLDAEPSQLAFRLRQAVRFLASRGVRVNWPSLLEDLLYWTHPDRFVQERWARSYFAG